MIFPTFPLSWPSIARDDKDQEALHARRASYDNGARLHDDDDDVAKHGYYQLSDLRNICVFTVRTWDRINHPKRTTND